MNRKRDKNGRFARQRHEVWNFDKWDDGYVANGRFRVYRPDYPGYQYGMGYTERAWVVWWLTHKEVAPDGYVIHHIDENKLNDRPENLTILEVGEHIILHKTKSKLVLTCQQCGEPYKMSLGRLNGRIKEKQPVKYCSKKCLYESSKAKSFMKICEHCNKEFLATTHYQRLKKRFCTISCATSYRYST